MKFFARTFYSNKEKEVSGAYFDINYILPFSEKELFVKVLIENNALKIVFSKLVKKKLKCYYVDLVQLEKACIKYILKNVDNLLPPNYQNTEYDHVSLCKKRK